MVKRRQPSRRAKKTDEVVVESPPPDEPAASPEPNTKKKSKASITIAQIKSDKLTILADQYWSPHTANEHQPYKADIIADIYNNEIRRKDAMRNIIMLEFSQYLENYLWPNYDPATSSHEHLMSIVAMANEKFRERVDAWLVFKKSPQNFAAFFQKVLRACLAEPKVPNTMTREQTALILFLNHCFNSMEVELCRDQTKKLVSLGMWACLQPKRREAELNATPQWKKFWKKLMKKDRPEQKEQLEFERHFLQRLMIKFINILESVALEGSVDAETVRYCERFLELLIDLEALLPTRRFFNTVLDDSHLVVRCALAPLIRREEGTLFLQLLDTLKFYAQFEINDETGDALTDHDMTQIHYSKIISLQRVAFAKFQELKMFALANVAAVDTREKLQKHFAALEGENLKQIAAHLNLIPDERDVEQFKWHRRDVDFLRELLISRHERRVSQLDALNDMPLYPTGNNTLAISLIVQNIDDSFFLHREHHLGREHRAERILFRRGLPVSAQIKSTISHATRLLAAQLQFVPSRIHLRNPAGHRRRRQSHVAVEIRRW